MCMGTILPVFFANCKLYFQFATIRYPRLVISVNTEIYLAPAPVSQMQVNSQDFRGEKGSAEEQKNQSVKSV